MFHEATDPSRTVHHLSFMNYELFCVNVREEKLFGRFGIRKGAEILEETGSEGYNSHLRNSTSNGNGSGAVGLLYSLSHYRYYQTLHCSLLYIYLWR